MTKNVGNELVTVIIPTYKATNRLQRAIDSVRYQSYAHIQIIVVDDNAPGSEGRLFTENLMASYRCYDNIVYVQHTENRNGSVARNTGLSLAQGTYCAFLDDDDVFYPSRIEECVDALTKNPEYDAVYTNVDIYKNDSYAYCNYALAEGYAWKELLLNEGMLGTGSNIFMRHSCVETIGMFDEDFCRYQDIEFMLRVLEKSKIIPIDHVLVRKNVKESHALRYDRLRGAFLNLINKFNYMIERLTKGEREFFFQSHYRDLLNIAISSKNVKYIIQAKQDMRLSGYELTFKDKIKCALPHLYVIYGYLMKQWRSKKKKLPRGMKY